MIGVVGQLAARWLQVVLPPMDWPSNGHLMAFKVKVVIKVKVELSRGLN